MRPADARRHVLIGLGGIGGLVARLLTPYLHHRGGRTTVVCVDGDRFEERNRSRQWFESLGPKATVLVAELGRAYGDRVRLVAEPSYLTGRNARALLRSGDVIFCQPDNFKTRHLVELRCARLRDVALFSGGNDSSDDASEGSFGNVQIYLRAHGRDRTNRLSTFHPEIAAPPDLLPTEQGCGAAARSAPQLLFTNAAVAVAMLGAYHAWSRGALAYEESYLDIVRGSHVPVRRELHRAARPRRRSLRSSA
jgi:hypothetical protein